MIDRGSMITDDSVKKEIDQLEKQIKSYKAMYILVGCYCSLYRLFFGCYGLFLQKLHHTNDFKDKLLIAVYNVAIFNLPWMLKPIFGYIGDIFSPFGYRAKGYIRIISLSNLVLLLAMIKYGNTDNLTWFLFAFVLLSSFLDSIAQGMTTIVVTMELRLEEKKNPFVEFRCKEGSEIIDEDKLEFPHVGTSVLSKNKVWEPSMVKNFAIYVTATYASYCVWLFVGFYCSLIDIKEQIEGIIISSSEEDIKKVSKICTGASTLLFFSTFFLSELQRTSWWSPNLRKKPFKVVLIGIFKSRNTYLIFVLALLSINPSNYFWEFAYKFFVVNSVQKHQVENPLYLSSPILVSGLTSFLLLLYIIKVWKYKKTIWYLKIAVAISLINLTNQYFMSLCENQMNWMMSRLMLYLYAVGGFIGLDVISAVIKVCLVDKFLLKSPKGYEVFYINMVLSLMSFTRALGKLVSSIEAGFWEISAATPRSIRITVYVNSMFVATAVGLYWLYKPKPRTGVKGTLKEGLQDIDGHSDYDLLHNSYNLDDWKKIDHPDSSRKPTLKRTMSTGDSISPRT